MKKPLHATWLLVVVSLLLACSDSVPTDPPMKFFSVSIQEGVVEPTRLPTSINEVFVVTLTLVNDDLSSVSLSIDDGELRALIEKQANGQWQVVGATGCFVTTSCDESGIQTLAAGATLQATAWFTLSEPPSGTGTYRLRVLATDDRDGSSLDEALLTSNAFDLVDTPLIDEPELFAPGVLSTTDEEWRIVFTPDGSTAYFARSDAFFPISREATIYTSDRVDGAWTAPTVASFSGTYPDIDPFITPDGSRLYFSSIRPVDGEPQSDLDLWFVDWTGTGWSTPTHAGAVNSPSDELYASIAEDGTLYVASDRPGGIGGFDIYRAAPLGDGQYEEAQNLGTPVNTTAWEFNPSVLKEGNTLVFTGLNYPGGAGFGDLYVTERTGMTWETPQSLGPLINTAADEYHPSFSPDERLLLFIRYGDDGDFQAISWPLRD